MKGTNITLAVAMTLLVVTSARAELRHVELKTLGMD
jgi:hypothetical protein